LSVRLSNITVRFGDTLALDGVDFEAHASEIHALVGENGAGKTTLMRVLYGAQRAEGRVEVEGAERHFRSSADAIAAGVGMVSQHYSVIPELTCLENLVLGAEPGWLLRRSAARQAAAQAADRMGFAFDWDSPAGQLGPAGCQKLELLKLLWRKSRTMILDEPTAMLAPADSAALFASLRSLADEGSCVIVVTHRLPEVLQHCQRVTVLRAGRAVGRHEVAGLDASRLAEEIVGRPMGRQRREPASQGPVRLEARGLRARGYRGDWALDGADLTLYEGEVVGLAGVDGNGQRELVQAVAGTLPAEGSVRYDGQDWSRVPTAQRILDGLRVIPEDRHAEAIVEEWSLAENAVVGLQRTPAFANGAWLDRRAAQKAAGRMAGRFATRHGGLGKPMASLSGGNQQRFVAARALDGKPRLVLAYQPARGLDIDATAAVYQGLREAARGGAAVLVVAFDLDELLEFCDRVVVVSRGRIAVPPAGAELDRAVIGRLMTEAG
jgi:simple sugar transport system ATP-binding protein